MRWGNVVHENVHREQGQTNTKDAGEGIPTNDGADCVREREYKQRQEEEGIYG